MFLDIILDDIIPITPFNIFKIASNVTIAIALVTVGFAAITAAYAITNYFIILAESYVVIGITAIFNKTSRTVILKT